MKKLAIFIIGILMIPNIVKADTIQITVDNQNTNPLTNEEKTWIEQKKEEILQEKEHYMITYDESYFKAQVWGYNDNDIIGIYYSIENGLLIGLEVKGVYGCNWLDRGAYNECQQYNANQQVALEIIQDKVDQNGTRTYYTYYDSDENIINTNAELEIEDFYSDNIVINQGDNFPKLKDLYQYNSWSDYENNHLENYTTVNLNNYDYVILTLKNYNQTEAFDTTLQVKGQIGITPIYNYGQTSKDEITGVKVQDRCNAYYENYTAYPLYIIQRDLQNNVVYAVKGCGENDSFKFSNEIFDITYVTQENAEDPIVTINGKQYHTIPLEDLPSTANKNEEENYIPGESGSAVDSGGLDGAIKNTKSTLSEIWNTFTYFTGLVNLLFSGLPTEIRTILLSAFTITIVLGIIKLFLR